MKAAKAGKLLTCVTYLALAVAACFSLYKGPIEKYRKNDTTLVSGEISVKGMCFGKQPCYSFPHMVVDWWPFQS